MSSLVIYQHDNAVAFRFQLVGRLEGAWVEELEQAWQTASSVLRGKELIVDVTALAAADEAGRALLARMRQAAASFTVRGRTVAPDLARSVGVPPSLVPVSAGRRLLRGLTRTFAHR